MIGKRIGISAVGLALLVLGAAAAGMEAIELREEMPTPLVGEGTVLRGIDGRIIAGDANDVWVFEFDEDVNDVGALLPAGTRIELLASVSLERMLADAGNRRSPRYRLTGQVTRYRDRNFLLPGYYLPLSRQVGTGESRQGGEDILNAMGIGRPDRNDVNVPPEILQQLRARGADGEAPSQRPRTRMIVDVVGFLRTHEGPPVFVPEALGYGVSQVSYKMLPCAELQQAEARQAARPEPVRLMITGIVTEYQGQSYLLLQRAIRTYNHGNFGR